jgi:predicted nucleotidyltransferase
MAQEPVKALEPILEYILSESIENWGKRLISVVMFGSFARGNAHEHSDIDLLVIVDNLPKDWRERGAFELSLERIGLKWSIPLQVILVEPEEVSLAINSITSLLLEIREGYYCLFDREGFFRNEMKRLEEEMIKRGVRKLAEHKWEVPDIARLAPCNPTHRSINISVVDIIQGSSPQNRRLLLQSGKVRTGGQMV